MKQKPGREVAGRKVDFLVTLLVVATRRRGTRLSGHDTAKKRVIRICQEQQRNWTQQNPTDTRQWSPSSTDDERLGQLFCLGGQQSLSGCGSTRRGRLRQWLRANTNHRRHRRESLDSVSHDSLV